MKEYNTAYNFFLIKYTLNIIKILIFLKLYNLQKEDISGSPAGVRYSKVSL